MTFLTNAQILAGLLKQARSYTSIMAGVADVEKLKAAPSYFAEGALDYDTSMTEEPVREVTWPEEAQSVLVLALSHPEDQPHLDWWDGPGGTPGNRRLIEVSGSLKQWCKQTLETRVHPLPYYVTQGGVFLKDAAVLAGLGVMGRNNLLLTPELGPRVRLRALFVERKLDPTGPLDSYDPCRDCPAPCQNVCPQNAIVDDRYSRAACLVQMEKDQNAAAKKSQKDENGRPGKCIKYCRECELACLAAF